MTNNSAIGASPDTWQPDTVIYHDNCADGFGAAWACWMRWGDVCEYVPAAYGQLPPDVAGKRVLIVDFSYKRAELDAMASTAASIVILDHHKTAQADLAPFAFQESSPGAISPADVPGMLRDLAELGRPSVIAIFDMNRSGARIAWNFCHRETEPPLLIRLIEDRDIWRFRLDATKPFALWLRAQPLGFTTFSMIAEQLKDPSDRGEIMIEARAMQRFFDMKVAELAAFARLGEIAGHEAIIVSCPPMFASEVCHALLDKHPTAQFAASYFDGREKRLWSLRSADDRLDVSEIATKFGGGGHRNAAGFSTPLPALLGEANLRTWRDLDPEAKADGTEESLANAAHGLEIWGAECFPANEHGQVDFVRCLMDSAAGEIRAYLAAREQASANDERTIAGRTLEGWRQLARRDDCFDQMVPSDLRLILAEIR